jgi:hypothetical protein
MSHLAEQAVFRLGLIVLRLEAPLLAAGVLCLFIQNVDRSLCGSPRGVAVAGCGGLVGANPPNEQPLVIGVFEAMALDRFCMEWIFFVSAQNGWRLFWQDCKGQAAALVLSP